MIKTVKSQSILAARHYAFCHEEFWDIAAGFKIWSSLVSLGTYCHCGVNTWQGQRSECSISLMLPDLHYPFKPFPRDCLWQQPTLFHSKSPWLPQPVQMMSLQQWCTSHPVELPCLGTFTNHSARRHPNPSPWQLRGTQGNHLGWLAGALRKLGEYLCIMSDAAGPIKRLKSGEWERQWLEWIKSVIPSFTWVSRDLRSHSACVCVYACVLLNPTSCVDTYSRATEMNSSN